MYNYYNNGYMVNNDNESQISFGDFESYTLKNKKKSKIDNYVF